MASRIKGDDVKIGAFVIVSLAILAAGSLWILGSGSIGRRQVPFVVSMPSSGGLEPGDRVRFAGVAVGRVQSVRLRPDASLPVALDITVRADVPVYVDTRATVGTTGLLGAAHLELLAGDTSEPLPAGGEIAPGPSSGIDAAFTHLDTLAAQMEELLGQASSSLEQLTTDLRPVLANVDRLMSDDNTEDLSAILSGLRATVEDTGPQLDRLLGRLDRAATSLDEAIATVPGATAEASALLTDLRTAVGPEGRRVAEVLEGARASLETATEALSAVADNRGEIDATLHDLRRTAAHLETFSKTISERPFSLVRARSEPDRAPGDGVRRKSR